MERWLPVVGFEGVYEVSDFGRVRSVDRVETYQRDGQTIRRLRTGSLLQPGTVKSGHQLVALGRGNTRLVHALVLTAFVGPRPLGFDSCHGDGNPANNRLDNLRWGTRSDNVQDSLRHGTHYDGSGVGEDSPRAILSEANVLEIYGLLGTMTHAQIGARFGVTKTAIGKIATGRNWSHLLPKRAA